MKLITSPAKLMQIDYTTNILKSTEPNFIKEAAFLQKYLKEETPLFLSELMDISPKLADENWHRNQNWNPNPSKNESCQAIFAFRGEVYRGLDAQSLDKSSINYLQKHYRILSGLYGLLKPSDSIMLYRLEMGRKYHFSTYKDLYGFWREKVTAQLNSEFSSKDILLNLASNEYFKVLDKKNINATIIDFDFYELKSGTPKTVVVYTKHARGLVVKYCAETNAKTLNDVKAFNYEGYRIDEEKSTSQKLVFVR